MDSETDAKVSNDDERLELTKDVAAETRANFRGMGFPNMNYLDPDANGPPLQQQSYYRNYEENQDNDVKLKRQELSNAKKEMPNNTFIKLFHFNDADNRHDANNNGDNDSVPRANRPPDELQSIQYIDVNYVESGVDTEVEANFDREVASSNRDVRIVYNPAKNNKSKSLGTVGLSNNIKQLPHFQREHIESK